MKSYAALILAAAIPLAACATANGSPVASSPAITEAEVAAAQKAWGEGIVNIGKVYSAGGDYRAAAAEHINKFYAYGSSEILFKPTLAVQDQFRGTYDEALSYFVKGSNPEDTGFAIAPFSNVRWENEGTIIASESAMAMGNYYFTTAAGNEIKVEYSFGYIEDANGDLKIVLHHSSVPYSPN